MPRKFRMSCAFFFALRSGRECTSLTIDTSLSEYDKRDKRVVRTITTVKYNNGSGPSTRQVAAGGSVRSTRWFCRLSAQCPRQFSTRKYTAHENDFLNGTIESLVTAVNYLRPKNKTTETYWRAVFRSQHEIDFRSLDYTVVALKPFACHKRVVSSVSFVRINRDFTVLLFNTFLSIPRRTETAFSVVKPADESPLF